MLVLSRKLGERIMIDGGITITVVDIDRGKIRLGIEAPRNVAVYRQELLPVVPAKQTLTERDDVTAKITGGSAELVPVKLTPRKVEGSV